MAWMFRGMSIKLAYFFLGPLGVKAKLLQGHQNMAAVKKQSIRGMYFPFCISSRQRESEGCFIRSCLIELCVYHVSVICDSFPIGPLLLLPNAAAGQALYGTCPIHVISYKYGAFPFIISPSAVASRLDSCKVYSRSKLTVYTLERWVSWR
ncbi:hypothetical protein F5Y01DRAFT_144159 [Xylaria sp. FL0043]|nr:hypothetical protein F5Y01DRAFT_144159 [Xylaria sp. FL0043]